MLTMISDNGIFGAEVDTYYNRPVIASLRWKIHGNTNRIPYIHKEEDHL